MADQDRHQRQKNLHERLKWLIACRLAIAAAFVIATLVLRPGEEATEGFSFFVFLLITVTHLVVAILFGLGWEWTPLKWVKVAAHSQIVWDIVFTTALIYVTGGVDSRFTFLYWLTIFNASVLFFKKGAYTGAFLSSLFYGALIDFEFLGWIPMQLGPLGDSNSWSEQKVMASIFMHTCGFFIIAYFSSYLSTRAREVESQLSAKSADLEDLEVLMRRIVESLTSGLATLDPKGKIKFWSQSAEQISGLGEVDVRGKKFSVIFPGAEEAIAQGANGVVHDHRSWRWEAPFQTKDHRKLTLGFSISPLHKAKGGENESLVIFQDLTEYRAMEDKIKRQDRLAAVGELAARMAHEIRNPLTSMAGSIEVLKNQLNLENQDRKLMEIVVRETDRLNFLLTDFLRFARPTAPQWEDIDLSNAIRETIELFSKSPGRNSAIEFDVELEEGILIRGDAKQISQMFWNLLKNASEAMPKAGVVKFSAVLEEAGRSVLVRIQDEGGGIPSEIEEQIFQPFFTTKVRGTGLGLATVRRVIEDHGGSIQLDRNVSKGTCFVVSFPLVEKVMEVGA